MKKTLIPAIVLFVFLGFCMPVHAQMQTQTQPQSQTQAAEPPPSTDIYLASLSIQNGKVHVGKPVNITNRKGYDNQPRFLPDGKSLFYTSIDDKGQADIFRYDIAGKSAAPVTQTPESEFSPTLMADGKNVSVVRVESDGTQRLWKFPLAGGAPELILPNIKPVGYHLWLGENSVVVFILGDTNAPNTLQLVDIKTGEATVLDKDIGRALQVLAVPTRFRYTWQDPQKQWWIKEYNTKSKVSTTVTKALPDQEDADFVWLPFEMMLIAKDSKLYAFSAHEWKEVADFSALGITGITRLAVSKNQDQIALVAKEN